jgi:hypothetical protein
MKRWQTCFHCQSHATATQNTRDKTIYRKSVLKVQLMTVSRTAVTQQVQQPDSGDKTIYYLLKMNSFILVRQSGEFN